MRKYAWIGFGGCLGAIARYGMRQVVFFSFSGSFPLNTLLINLVGSFGLAFFLALVSSGIKVDEDIKLAVSSGFFGAFTTFSALCRETAVLLQNGHSIQILLYLVLSIAGGLGAVYAGFASFRIVSGRRNDGEEGTQERPQRQVK